MALTDNILAYWKLDNDGSGGVSLVDSTGNSNTLTNNGGVTLGTGIIAGDAVFVGGNNQALINNAISCGRAFSISLWVKLANLEDGNFGNPNYLSTAWSSGPQIHMAAISDGGAGWVQDFSYQTAIPTGNISLALNEWVHLVFVSDGTYSKVYTNGALDSYNPNDTTDYSFNGINIGFYYATCQLDEIGVWNRPISAQEVQDLYYGGIGNAYPFTNTLPIPLTAGCKAYWKLDNDGSGGLSLVDSTGNANTLTNNGGVSLESPGFLGSGDAIFDGSGYLGASSPVLPNGTEAFSFSAWLKTTDNSTNMGIAGQFPDWAIGHYGITYWYVKGFQINGPNIADGQWHNVVLIYDGSTISGYIDGSLYVSSSCSGSFSNSAFLNIGNFVSSLNWNGQIDEVGIWNRALTPQEVSALYNNGNGLTYPVPAQTLANNILAYWNLDNDGSGNVSLVDSTGNGNTLTNNNGVTLGAGVIADGAIFDGTNYLETQTLSLNEFSFSCWFKNTDSNQSVFQIILPTQRDQLGFYVIGNAFYSTAYGNTSTLLGYFNFEADVYYHVAITRNSANIVNVYINGIKITDGSIALYNTINDSLNFGGHSNYIETRYFNCAYDEMGLWTRALTANEIYNLYYNGTGNTYPFTKTVIQPPRNGWDSTTNTYYINGEATTLNQSGSGVWRGTYYYNGYPITLPDPSTVALGTTYGYNNQLTGTMTGTSGDINLAQLLGLPPFITI